LIALTWTPIDPETIEVAHGLRDALRRPDEAAVERVLGEQPAERSCLGVLADPAQDER